MGIYIATLVLGLINFVYIYVFKFDSLTEDQLVLYTPIWLLLFIFGAYGIFSCKLMREVKEGHYQNMRAALVESSKSFGIFGPLRQIFFFPLIFLNVKNVFFLALVSTLIWAVLLVLFLQFIFPEL